MLVGWGMGDFSGGRAMCPSREKNKKTNFPNPIDFTTKMGYNINVVTHRKGQSTIMKANEIIGKAMEKEKVTQKALAEAMGLKSAQAVGNILYRENSVRANSFVKMLDIMGYEVIVRKKIGETEEWKVEA